LETAEASGHYFRVMKHSEASKRLWDCYLAHLKKGFLTAINLGGLDIELAEAEDWFM